MFMQAEIDMHGDEDGNMNESQILILIVDSDHVLMVISFLQDMK